MQETGGTECKDHFVRVKLDEDAASGAAASTLNQIGEMWTWSKTQPLALFEAAQAYPGLPAGVFFTKGRQVTQLRPSPTSTLQLHPYTPKALVWPSNNLQAFGSVIWAVLDESCFDRFCKNWRHKQLSQCVHVRQVYRHLQGHIYCTQLDLHKQTVNSDRLSVMSKQTYRVSVS